LTTRERAGWVHRVAIRGPKATCWTITEQIRTISAGRLFDTAPAWTLDNEESAEVRTVLSKMIDLTTS
jgi:mRNA interferase MazF